MDRRSLNPYFTHVLMLTLVGSFIPAVLPSMQSFASHSDLEIEVSPSVVEGGDEVVISGEVDGGDENDQVDINIDEAGGGSEGDSVDLDDDGQFDFTYDVPTSPDDGVYIVEVQFETDDPVFSYFIVDEENDEIDVVTDDESYELGDEVVISGTVDEDIIDSEVDEVEITVLDPNNDEVLESEDVEIDNSGDFEFDALELSDEDDAHGMYAILVSYDDDELGWNLFEVTEGGSSSGSDITAVLEDATLSPGDEVVITGSIEETDVDPGEEMNLDVEDDNGDPVHDDSVEPENDGFFRFEFELEDDAESGIYTITLTYAGLDDKTLTFTVSSSTNGGSSGGSGSGSSGGLTARLSKTSLLAGETLTVSGVVPQVSGDEPVNISVLRPNGAFVAASFPDPDEDDESYSATIRLPTTLEEDEDYSVVVSYNGREVEVNFDITGQVSGSDGGPLTVRTDKASYASGSTVRITGAVASDSIIEDKQIALQVYNPDEVLYRFDPITPESDGSYSYQMAVGGPLGVTGEWEVKVTYDQLTAETTFDLTGGAPSSPTFNLQVGDLTFPIEYQSDGTVKNMFVRPSDNKLVVSIEAEEDGTLTIELPREVIDASEGGSDIEYIVVISDFDTGSEEVIEVTESTTTDEARTLVIDYQAGTDLIEIQGTRVVPEFGILAAIILAISLLSVIGFTRFSHRLGNFR